MQPLLLKLVFDKTERSPMPFFIKPIAKAISGKAKWFVGYEFTAADVQMSFPIEAGAARGGLNASRP